MFGALAVVNAIAAAKRVEAIGSPRMFLTCNMKRIDHALRRNRWMTEKAQFGIEETHVKTRVVNNERRIADEGEEILGDGSEDRLITQKRG